MTPTADLSALIAKSDMLDTATLTADGVRDALINISRVQAWVDSHKLALSRRLQQLKNASASVVPEQIMARACSVTRTEATRDCRRAHVLDLLPQLEQAFDSGHISAAHIDAAARTFVHLSDNERLQLATRDDWLAKVACRATPDNFGRAVKQTVGRLRADDGVGLLDRQRRAAWLRHWVDRDSGMVCLRGEFDPESALHLVGRLQHQIDQLAHGPTPDTCVDGQIKHDHLNALGLVALISRHAAGGLADISSANARAEVSVIVDYRTLASGIHAQSVLHTGTGIDIPIETVRRIACTAQIIPVVLGTEGVVLDMGRATRLASKHQRRALEAMYTTCAIPDCTTPIAQCHPHHVQFWAMGGNTDLNNLVPLCGLHHRCVHEGGWKLHLSQSNRQLSVQEPAQHGTKTSLPGQIQHAHAT